MRAFKFMKDDILPPLAGIQLICWPASDSIFILFSIETPTQRLFLRKGHNCTSWEVTAQTVWQLSALICKCHFSTPSWQPPISLNRSHNSISQLDEHTEIFKMGSNSTSTAESNCNVTYLTFQYSLYATTYIFIFIPGLLANSAALWGLCYFISK